MLKMRVRNIPAHAYPCLFHTEFAPQSRIELRKAIAACIERDDCSDGTIGEWDVSGVTDMNAIVSGAGSFKADISKWDVSSVISMGDMFSGAASFNADISKWNVSSVTDMAGMFHGAISFTSDISKWDVSHVTDMRGMFYGAISFNADISAWNVSQVTDMRGMFYAAISFNVQISSWNVSRVTDMRGMFFAAISFNQTLCGASWVHSEAKKHQMFAGSTGSTSPSRCAKSIIASSITCRKCGTEKSGKPSCCGPDGAWFKNCGDVGDTRFDHTWSEGIRTCNRKSKVR